MYLSLLPIQPYFQKKKKIRNEKQKQKQKQTARTISTIFSTQKLLVLYFHTFYFISEALGIYGENARILIAFPVST